MNGVVMAHSPKVTQIPTSAIYFGSGLGDAEREEDYAAYE
jgi:hypothetical protein